MARAPGVPKIIASLSKQNTVLRALEQKNRTVIPKKKNPLRSELTQQQ